MNGKDNIGVFLARFQPFHKSHEYLIRESLKNSKKTYVFIGSADKSRTERNPLTYEERKKYLEDVFNEELENGILEIYPMKDKTNENDSDTYGWGDYLYRQITTIIEDDMFSMYYSDDRSTILSWFRDDILMNIKLKLYNREDILKGLSATKIRQALVEDDTEYLQKMLPKSVYNDIETLKQIILEIRMENNNKYRLNLMGFYDII